MKVPGTVVLALVLTASGGGPLLGAEAGEGYRGMLVVHALGAIDGNGYTNSPAAFDVHYANGRRWFEVDLALTSDGELVCFHYGAEAKIGLAGGDITKISTADFLSRKALGQYPLITFRQLIEKITPLADVTLVTDTKTWTSETANAFEAEMARTPAPVRQRIIPQLYHTWEFRAVRGIEKRLGPFRAIIFTLYQTKIPDDQVVALVKKERIPFVTMNSKRFSAQLVTRLHDAGAMVLVHTLNDHEEITSFAESGADGFYTDFYRPFSDYFPATK